MAGSVGVAVSSCDGEMIASATSAEIQKQVITRKGTSG
jgi:hypothetical protein